MLLKEISMRGRFFCAAMCLAFAVSPLRAQTRDDFPNKPVTIVVPFAVGGPTDAVARVLADALHPRLGVPVIIDNKPGAGGAIANDFVAKSAPNGYTLLLAGSSLTMNPALSKVNYDPVKDYAPVSMVLSLELYLMARQGLPVRTLQELITYVKANPGKLSYGSTGNGSVTHLQMELLKSLTGMHIVHIPYRGSAPAMTAMLSGDIDLLFDSMATSGPHVKSGALRPLAIAMPTRSRLLPDVPTVEEAGVRGFDASAWSGILAPVGTPSAVIKRLSREIGAAAQDETFQRRVESIGGIVASSSPEQFGEKVRVETVKWSKLAKERGLKAD
jgi:tripartite-type tricarboxylate transporter receptor subunit TctC